MDFQGCLNLHSLMTRDVEHFFGCFSAIQYSSVENSLFSSVHHFLIGLFDFPGYNFFSSLYILDISSLSDVGLVSIFSQTAGCRFDSVLCFTEALQFFEVPFVDCCS